MSFDIDTKCPFCDVNPQERKVNVATWNLIETMTDRIASLQNRVVSLTESLSNSMAATDAALMACDTAVSIGHEAITERDHLRRRVNRLVAILDELRKRLP